MAKVIKVDPSNCASGCGGAIYSISSGEIWHEACWQEHRADVQKTGTTCDDHAMCRKTQKAHKAKLKAEFAKRRASHTLDS